MDLAIATLDHAGSSSLQVEAPRNVARSAGIVSACLLLSRITGLAREMVMAYKFGAGFTYDCFVLGFRIPNLTRDLFAEGALSSAFVPTFTSALSKNGKNDAAHLANLVATAVLVIVGLVCVTGAVFAPLLVRLLAPGFSGDAGKFALAIRLTRIMFPFLLLVALSTQVTGILNSSGKFGVPALSSSSFNVGAVVFGLLLGFRVGPHIGLLPIEGMAYGVVLGGMLQVACQFPALRRLDFHFKPAWDWSHPGLRRIFSLVVPAVIANAAVQVNVVINTSFASNLADPLRGPNGPISWLGYAFRFVQLPLGLFGVALASALLPSFSRSAALCDFEELRRKLARSLSVLALLTIPCSFGLIVLARPIVGVVYQSGRFGVYDTDQTALALSCYAVGLLGYTSVRILNPAFYALADSRTPMYVSLLSIGVNLCLPLVLVKHFHYGFSALALTTALAVSLESLSLFECLRRRLGGLGGYYLASQIIRITAASAIMAGIIGLVTGFVSRAGGSGRWSYFVELLVLAPLGLGIFLFLARAFRVREIEIVCRPLLASFRGKFTRAC